MPMLKAQKSRLSQLRTDQGSIITCVVISALLLACVGIYHKSKMDEQALLKAQADRQAQITAQQQADAAQQAQADLQRSIAIEANAQGWRRWQALIEPQCQVMVKQLDLKGSYLGKPIGNGRFTRDGLILCDQNRVGILKGASLKVAWAVPRATSPLPLPTGQAPPPEFAPPAQIKIIR